MPKNVFLKDRCNDVPDDCQYIIGLIDIPPDSPSFYSGNFPSSSVHPQNDRHCIGFVLHRRHEKFYLFESNNTNFIRSGTCNFFVFDSFCRFILHLFYFIQIPEKAFHASFDHMETLECFWKKF